MFKVKISKMNTGTRKNRVCIFCCKNTDLSEHVFASEPLVKRFITVVQRHFEARLRSKLWNNRSGDCKFESCQNCLKIVKSFCNVYHQMQCLEMELDWKLRKLKLVMRSANKVGSRMELLRAAYEKFKHDQSYEDKDSYEIVKGFRQELVRKCSQHIAKSFPKVVLNDVASVGVKQERHTTNQDELRRCLSSFVAVILLYFSVEAQCPTVIARSAQNSSSSLPSSFSLDYLEDDFGDEDGPGVYETTPDVKNVVETEAVCEDSQHSVSITIPEEEEGLVGENSRSDTETFGSSEGNDFKTDIKIKPEIEMYSPSAAPPTPILMQGRGWRKNVQRSRKFRCDICINKAFMCKSSLKSHILRFHTNPKSWRYSCNYCNKKFFQTGEFNVHKKRMSHKLMMKNFLRLKKKTENGIPTGAIDFPSKDPYAQTDGGRKPSIPTENILNEKADNTAVLPTKKLGFTASRKREPKKRPTVKSNKYLEESIPQQEGLSIKHNSLVVSQDKPSQPQLIEHEKRSTRLRAIFQCKFCKFTFSNSLRLQNHTNSLHMGENGKSRERKDSEDMSDNIGSRSDDDKEAFSDRETDSEFTYDSASESRSSDESESERAFPSTIQVHTEVKVTRNTEKQPKRKLFNHLTDCKNEDLYTCEIQWCHKRFEQHEDYLSHKILHGSFPCNYCTYVANYAPNLALHKGIRHSQSKIETPNEGEKDIASLYPKLKLYRCARCPYWSPRKNIYVNHHLEQHLGLTYKINTCPICKVKLLNKLRMRYHIQKIHGEPGVNHETIYKCDIDGCSAYFLKEMYLSSHKKTFHKEPDEIGYTLQNSDVSDIPDVDTVLETGSGEDSENDSRDSYGHEVSSKGGSRPRNILVKCQFCKRKFKSIRSLVTHNQWCFAAGNTKLKGGPKSKYKITCTVLRCAATFRSSEELKNHSKLHGEFKCIVCPVVMKYAPNLALHEITHKNTDCSVIC